MYFSVSRSILVLVRKMQRMSRRSKQEIFALVETPARVRWTSRIFQALHLAQARICTQILHAGWCVHNWAYLVDFSPFDLFSSVAREPCTQEPPCHADAQASDRSPRSQCSPVRWGHARGTPAVGRGSGGRGPRLLSIPAGVRRGKGGVRACTR